MKIGVISLGCDKNTVDTECMLYYLKAGGHTLANSTSDAEIIIINTCAFIASAREEAISTILEMAGLKQSNLKKLIVTGCLSEKYIDEIFDELTEVDAFLGIKQYPHICNVLQRVMNGERVNGIADYKQEESGINRIVSTPYYYAYVRIADGCDNHCTYCTIPSIRGEYISLPKETIIEQVKGLVAGGVKEIILVAQDITKYGCDLYGKIQLCELLRELSAIDGVKWIRLLYCYPDNITSRLLDEIVENPKICKYIDVPFQHYDDSILKYMGRKITSADIDALVLDLEKRGIYARSTFIVGFPFEDESKFENLYAFVKKGKILNAGFFAYSREEGTPAYRLREQVDEDIKKERLNAIYEIQKRTYIKNYSKLLGTVVDVICEGVQSDKKLYFGRTQFMAPNIDGLIYFSSGKPIKTGEFCKVKITYFNDYDLIGETL